MNAINKAFRIGFLAIIIVAFTLNFIFISYAQEDLTQESDEQTMYRPGVISAGLYHTILVNESGEVYSWGDNSNGQLGIGDLMNLETPMHVTGLTDVIKVSAGDYHSLALTNSGDVYAWGRNSYGQIGNGGTSVALTPVRVDNIPPITDISAGGLHSLALGIDGFVYAWGMNTDGQVGKVESETIYDKSESVLGMRVKSPQKIAGPNIKKISAGGMHSLYIDEAGKVFAWGNNEYGQLGDGTNISRSEPQQVQNLDSVIDISSGYFYNLAVSATPSEKDSKLMLENLYSWGSNSSGQLGLGMDMNEKIIMSIPTKIDIKGDLNKESESISLISAGYLSSIITTRISNESNKEHIYVWGNNDYTQLGIGKISSQSKPVKLVATSSGWTGDEFLPFSSITSGGYHTALLSVKGFVGMSGRGDKAQLGNVSAIDADKFLGVKIKDKISPEWIGDRKLFGNKIENDLHLSWSKASDNIRVVGYMLNYLEDNEEPKTIKLKNVTEYVLKNFNFSFDQIVTIEAVDASENTSEYPLEFQVNNILEENQDSNINPIIYGDIIPLEVPWDIEYIYGTDEVLPPKDNSLLVASAITASFVILFILVGLSSFNRTRKENKINSNNKDDKLEKNSIKVGESVSIVSNKDEEIS